MQVPFGNTTTDLKLIREHNDSEACERLFSKFWDSLLYNSQKRISNPRLRLEVDLEVVAQSTLVAAYRVLREKTDREKTDRELDGKMFRGLLKAIHTRKVAQAIRSRSTLKRCFLRICSTEFVEKYVANRTCEAVEESTANELMEKIDFYLNSKTENIRDVLELAWKHFHSNREIAEMLQIPLRTVQGYVQHSREELAKELALLGYVAS